MKTPHLLAAGIILCSVFTILIAGVNVAQNLEMAYVHALASLNPDINIEGIALQRAAFQQADLLPVYGASEELEQSSEYQDTRFFSKYPTGFSPFEVSHLGSGFIIDAQALAAVGAVSAGKKVVYSFTPDQLTGVVGQFHNEMMDARPYTAFFSRLDANELIFSSQLSYPTKRLAARRMLEYPDTLQSDSLLQFAVRQLADGSFLSRLFYTLTFPLGRLQTVALELQDHYQTAVFIGSLKNTMANVTRQHSAVDWKSTLVEARRKQIEASNNNPFGFDNTAWTTVPSNLTNADRLKANMSFINGVRDSTGWTDLELLLRISKELGTHPLLLARPVNRTYFHAIGVTDDAIQMYDDKLEKMAKSYGVTLVDFKEFESDMYFSVDSVSHTSREGWVYVDQALDSFFHQPEN